MPEIGTSSSMSGDGKRSAGHWPQATAPILDSTSSPVLCICRDSVRYWRSFCRASDATGMPLHDLGCAKTPKGGPRRGIAFPLRLKPSSNVNDFCKSIAIPGKSVLRFRDAVAFSRGQDPEQSSGKRRCRDQ